MCEYPSLNSSLNSTILIDEGVTLNKIFVEIVDLPFFIFHLLIIWFLTKQRMTKKVEMYHKGFFTILYITSLMDTVHFLCVNFLKLCMPFIGIRKFQISEFKFHPNFVLLKFKNLQNCDIKIQMKLIMYFSDQQLLRNFYLYSSVSDGIGRAGWAVGGYMSFFMHGAHIVMSFNRFSAAYLPLKYDEVL